MEVITTGWHGYLFQHNSDVVELCLLMSRCVFVACVALRVWVGVVRLSVNIK